MDYLKFGHILPLYGKVNEFIDNAINVEGGKVLVHGNCGVNTSAAFVIAYVMHVKGWTAE